MIRTIYLHQLETGAVQPDPKADVLGVVRKEMFGITELVDRNIPELGPPEDLLEAFKKVEDAADTETAWRSVRYEQQFSDYLDENHDAQDYLDRVAARAADRPVYLVCYCGDERYCHRRLLAERLGASSTVHSGDIRDACDNGEHTIVTERGIRYCEDCEIAAQTIVNDLGHEVRPGGGAGD